MLPVTIPVTGSNDRPSGNPCMLKRTGRSPVHGIRYRNGDPGWVPYTAGELITGVAGGAGVRISSGPGTTRLSEANGAHPR